MIESLGHIRQVDDDLLAKPGCVHFTYSHDAFYRGDDSRELIHVLLLNVADKHFGLLTDADVSEALAEWSVNSRDDLEPIARSLDTSVLDLSAPLPLQTVNIPKPWGQEIWYSGIEARGVCAVNGISLAWIVDIFGPLIGTEAAPILLKILDPLPDDNLGDLYFEMHEEKIEVYVVTNVDTVAWPDGRGRIRYGFNQALLADYDDRDAFLRDYVTAVNAYREIRNAIDAGEKGLEKREASLREAMYRFTALKQLEPGDVVTVQPHVPHSLQHGVRVIEFQTPHYERYILSFGQKVLTQDHWDTEQALTKAVTDDVSFDQPVRIADGRDLIADFSAFRVERITLEPGENIKLSPRGYTMVIGVTGEMQMRCGTVDVTVPPESAYLNPQSLPLAFENTGRQTASLLVAEEV